MLECQKSLSETTQTIHFQQCTKSHAVNVICKVIDHENICKLELLDNVSK